MRIAAYAAMHGRQDTVKKCINYLSEVKESVKGVIELELIYGYTTESDGNFLKQWPHIKTYQAPNDPLWQKFYGGMDILRNEDYDACIMIGSDDIFDSHYLLLAASLLEKYDYIGSEDIYFHDVIRGQNYYWSGYDNHRVGEPAGAGRVYSRKAMEAFDFKIFQPSNDRGLDRGCHDTALSLGLNLRLINCRKENVLLCDVKDGTGLTPISRFKSLEKIDTNFFAF